MEDLDKQLEGMKQNVMGLQVWNPDSTSYFQASGGDDKYSYVDGIDPYSYAKGDDPYSYGNGDDPYSYAGGENLQKLFDFVGKNKENIKVIGGVAGGLASGGTGSSKPCKGLFGGALKRKFGRCSDAPEPVASVTPEKSNTGLYIGIGAGVLVIGVMTFLLIRKK
jgi:hypothetical protein